MSLAEQIALSFHLPEKYVRGVAGTASHRYKQYRIRKADGQSFRTIEQPTKELKLFQRWLVRRIFDSLPTHPCAHAYVKKRSIRTNAEVHQKSKYISRLDLENFFPSLTSVDLDLLLRRKSPSVGGQPLSDDDIRMVCWLTCRFGRLTIGAPSSPTISNKLLYDLDTRIATIAADSKVNFTRYADDLYFSCSQGGVLYEVCKKVEAVLTEFSSPSLRINKKKTYHASRKRRMAVTGIRVTPQGNLSVGREIKRKIRVFAHRASKKTIREEDLGWLRGMLAYVASIEPRFVEQIRYKYGLG